MLVLKKKFKGGLNFNERLVIIQIIFARKLLKVKYSHVSQNIEYKSENPHFWTRKMCNFLQGHTVVVFNENGIFQRRIGFENITNFPNGIDVSGDQSKK